MQLSISQREEVHEEIKSTAVSSLRFIILGRKRSRLTKRMTVPLRATLLEGINVSNAKITVIGRDMHSDDSKVRLS